MGMIKRGRCLGLSEEALLILFFPEHPGNDKFQRNSPFQLEVLCLVDYSHTPRTQLFQYLVMGDFFADHRAFSTLKTPLKYILYLFS